MIYAIDKRLHAYFEGSAFSNGLTITLASGNNVRQSVLPVLRQILAGKSIIHVGCADHLQLIDQKRAKGVWVHDQLLQVATRCLGIDINVQAVAYLKEKLGYQDIIVHDLTSAELPASLVSQSWDFMFMGDMLEHLDNPVAFLRQVHGLYKDRVQRLLISVPNAFSVQNFMFMLNNQECINTDHRYWFSIFTLAKLLVLSGFTPCFYTLADRSPAIAPNDPLTRQMMERSFINQDTIIMGSDF